MDLSGFGQNKKYVRTIQPKNKETKNKVRTMDLTEFSHYT